MPDKISRIFVICNCSHLSDEIPFQSCPPHPTPPNPPLVGHIHISTNRVLSHDLDDSPVLAHPKVSKKASTTTSVKAAKPKGTSAATKSSSAAAKVTDGAKSASNAGVSTAGGGRPRRATSRTRNPSAAEEASVSGSARDTSTDRATTVSSSRKAMCIWHWSHRHMTFLWLRSHLFPSSVIPLFGSDCTFSVVDAVGLIGLQLD